MRSTGSQVASTHNFKYRCQSFRQPHKSLWSIFQVYTSCTYTAILHHLLYVTQILETTHKLLSFLLQQTHTQHPPLLQVTFCITKAMDHAQYDMFSDLPLHLVLIIISHLSLSEAFRLCVLKKEWFYAKLWRNCNSIEIHETSFTEISNRRRWSDNLGKSSFRDTVLRDIGKLRFVHFLNTTLPQLISPTLITFNLQMAYASKYTNYIDQWIGFALSKNAKVLILDFSDANPNSMQTPNTYYVLPHFLYENGECIRFLSLNTCYLDNHTFCSFESLKVLWMTNVMIFTGKLTDLLLIRCPLLEDLVLVECCNLIQVEIFYSLERLKRLVVRHCGPLTDGIQLMCLPMLQYVEYVGRFCTFEVDELDALEEVVLDFRMDPYRKDEPRRFQEIREALFGFVHAIMVIKVTTFAFKVLLLEYMSGPPLLQLRNVHHLTLVTCMRKYELPGILSFLKSAPNLRGLTIASVFIWPRVATNHHDNLELPDEFWTPQGWSLDHLEWVQIDGFTGKEYEVNLLKFILRNAKMLHKIVITPRNRGNASKVFEELANVEVASERVFIEWCNVEDTKQKEHVCFKRLGQNEAVKP